MNKSQAEILTDQFYQWEGRGRGWFVYPIPVQLEPPFKPFNRLSLSDISSKDDSVRPGIFGRIGKFLAGSNESTVKSSDGYEDFEVPELYDFQETITCLSITVPKGYKVTIEQSEQLLLMLSNCNHPVSFEIIGSSTSIILQFACRVSDAVYVESQIKAYFPQSTVKTHADAVDMMVTESQYLSVTDFGLKEEFMRPLCTARDLKLDPFIGVFGAFEQLQENEQALIQIQFTGTRNPWSTSILWSVTGSDGKSFFADDPDMLPLAKVKVSAPLFAVTIKVMGAGASGQNAINACTVAGRSLGRIFSNFGNSLVRLNEYGEDLQDMADDILLRTSQRLGMLLNVHELVALVHIPSDTVSTSKLERDVRKTKAAPKITEGHKYALGTNVYQGKEETVSIPTVHRFKHMHVIGATGTGKSTLLQSLIVQDMQNGKGLAVLDPHGDLIESILGYVPEHRFKDVVIIDPADADWPVGFNILTAHSEIEKDILSSDLVAVFRRLSTSWGDQMNSVFANAILAFLESSQGGTLVDLRRFLVEKGFREAYLKTISDPSVVYYWQKEFPLLKSSSIGPILTRLDAFLRPKLIRNMVAQRKSLDFEQILDSGKILLVKLSQGLIGTENSYLLGTFFVTKIYQAAMARQIKGKDARNDFFLYIDEFQNFITPSMSAILSGARKYNLGMILAHQDMEQLKKYNSELASSVVANAGTRICFRLGDIDAKRFENGFSFFEAHDLENLDTGQAIARVERPEFDFSLDTVQLDIPLPVVANAARNEVINQSREVYGTHRQEVEAILESLRESGNPVITNKNIQIAEPAGQEVIIKSDEQVPKPSLKPVEVSAQEVAAPFIQKKQLTEHRMLQMLIKKIAESRGYVAKLEEPTPDGKGRVDVSLERNGKRIAVEVCVTTEMEWELHNIEKCVAANYDVVVTCSNTKTVLDSLGQSIKQLSPTVQKAVCLFTPDEFFAYLDHEAAQEAGTEVRIKGYRVKVDFTPQTPSGANNSVNVIKRAILDSKGRPKKQIGRYGSDNK